MKINRHIPLIYGAISLLITIFFLVLSIKTSFWVIDLLWIVFGGFFLWLTVINFKVGFHRDKGLLKKLTNKRNLSRGDRAEIKRLINKA